MPLQAREGSGHAQEVTAAFTGTWVVFNLGGGERSSRRMGSELASGKEPRLGEQQGKGWPGSCLHCWPRARICVREAETREFDRGREARFHRGLGPTLSLGFIQ